MPTITPAATQLLADPAHEAFRVRLGTLPADYVINVPPGGLGGLTVWRPNLPEGYITPAELANPQSVGGVIRRLAPRQFWDVWAANIGAIVTFILVAAFLLWMTGSFSDGSVLTRLREQDFARGLITFAIAISTILLGFILVINAMFGQSDEDRYRRGREVFTGMMGVLGTIVGFYFGTSQQHPNDLQLAPLEFPKDGDKEHVYTHVTGGIPPYTYTIDFGKETPSVSNKVSDKGWIREAIPATVPQHQEVKVTATDKANHQVTLSGKRP